MRKYTNQVISLILLVMLFVSTSYAGNKQRIGQAGGNELLINPWARYSGFGEANIANSVGLESVFVNVAGTAHLNKTELVFANSNWFSGADISVNAFGLSQKVGDVGVLSLTVMTMDWGEISQTTENQPDGDGKTFHPNYTNIGISYAKEFSNSIYGGASIKIISESLSDIGATGIAFDAGIQYITGSREQIKIGVTMKNVGPTMKMSGDGMSFRGQADPDEPIMTMEMRSSEYELPSLIKLGASYDFDLGEMHVLTLMGAFTENSFSKNQFHSGLQYTFKDMLTIRGGYVHEDGINDDVESSTAFTGLCAGFSFQVPLKKGGDQKFAIDYSYRDTDTFSSIHTIGVRFSL
ncbi:MAG: PorV/PorQ family protein [Salinivirgaceae bacterium]|nr:PorV/PorQ family protein [Salinivirgaceae bacterium]